jgi:hypothetical protein
MEWTQFLIMILTMGGLFFWNRSESNADRRDMVNLIIQIKDEMKDFHGRLEKQDAEFKASVLVLEGQIVDIASRK